MAEWAETVSGAQIEPEVVTVLLAVPELAHRYLDLAQAADDDPGAAALFDELADHVVGLSEQAAGATPGLDRCLAAVEQVATTSPDAEDLVAWCFLDAIPPETLRWLRPRLGPATAALLASIEDDGR